MKEGDLLNIFGSRLKSLREEKRMTGEELGKVFNVTKVAISNWESGNRSPHHEILSSIADYFDVSIDYLLGRTDEKNSKVKLDESIKTISAKKINVNEDLPDEAYDKINEYIKMVEMMYKNKDK